MKHRQRRYALSHLTELFDVSVGRPKRFFDAAHIQREIVRNLDSHLG